MDIPIYSLQKDTFAMVKQWQDLPWVVILPWTTL